MVCVVDVAIDLPKAQMEACVQSVEELASALEFLDTSFDLAESFPDLLIHDPAGAFIFREDFADLITAKPLGLPTFRAGKLNGFEIKPSDRYKIFCSAVAEKLNTHSIRVVHGWPILSVGMPLYPTVAAGDGDTIPAIGRISGDPWEAL